MLTRKFLFFIMQRIRWLLKRRRHVYTFSLICFHFQFNYALTFMFVGEICLVIFVFIFYFVPDAKQKLGLFPQAAMEDAIVKYGIVDDEDMVNLIDNIQRSVRHGLYDFLVGWDFFNRLWFLSKQNLNFDRIYSCSKIQHSRQYFAHLNKIIFL